jgi:hypothetical protein
MNHCHDEKQVNWSRADNAQPARQYDDTQEIMLKNKRDEKQVNWSRADNAQPASTAHQYEDIREIMQKNKRIVETFLAYALDVQTALAKNDVELCEKIQYLINTERTNN